MEKADLTPKPKNVFKRIWHWLTGIGSVMNRRHDENLNSEAPESKEIPESVKQLYDNIAKETDHYRKSLLLPEVEQDFLLSVRFMVDAGIRDGIDGIKNAQDREMKIIAQSRASRLFKLAKAVLGGMQIKAQTEEQAKGELSARCKEQDMRQHHELEVLQYYRRQHARSFSRGWGLLCILAGFLLFVTDIPLSQKLFENGFNLYHYESYIIAGGFSLSTIFIKVYYDNYIGVKYGNELMVDSRFSEMFKVVTKEKASLSQEEYSAINKKEQSRSKKWYNAILSLTVATILVLGIFRVEVVKNMNFNKVNYIINLLTFTFLSLIFPIISGICLSIGFNCQQNRRHYKEAIRKCKDSEVKYIEALKEYTSAQKENGDIESEIAKWSEKDFAESHTQILLSYYVRGYKAGLANPGTGTNVKELFRIAELWRTRAFARKMNNHIIKISEL
jgi:hypothetical protein